MHQVKIGRTATTLHRDSDGDFVCVYHATSVVRFNDYRIVLDHGGYQTNTTKKRMNEVSSVHDLGYGVFQRGGQWYICLYDKDKDNGHNVYNPDRCYSYTGRTLTIYRDTPEVCDHNGATVQPCTIG